MTAASRATLKVLIADGAVERVPVDAGVCAKLLRQADNHLRTAAAGVAENDNEGAFQLAYDACRKICLALVLATGLRPKGDGQHAVTFEAAAAIAHAFGQSQSITEAAQLRYVRHGAEYRAQTVRVEDAHEAITMGQDLSHLLTPNIERIINA